ncbi:MAG: YiiD C-terminal domain-containing protein [Jatrophihabitans sp.]
MTETPEPSAADQLNAGLATLIPRAHQMGVRFVELRPGNVRAEVPFEGNGNHFGVIYAGVIFTVAEVLGGAIHFATFDVSTHYPLVRSLTIDFLKPGTGKLVASASMTDHEVARITVAAQPGAKVAFVVETEVVGEDGAVVAKTRGDYQLRPYGA